MASFIDLPQKEEFTETINEIIELRSQRKYLFETNIADNKRREEALTILRDRSESLKNTARSLYSTVSSANNRVFSTEEPEFISAEVKPNAPVGDYEIEILQLGDKQLLVSDPLPGKLDLPESKIEVAVGEKNISFEYLGGNAQNFSRTFNERMRGYFTANWIKKSAEESFFVIQANQVGLDHRFNLQKDSGNLFIDLKLLKPKPPVIKTFVKESSLAEVGWEIYNEDMLGVIIPPGAIPSSRDKITDRGGNLEKTAINQDDGNNQPGSVSLNTMVDFLETQHVFFKVDILLPQPPALEGKMKNEHQSSAESPLSSSNQTSKLESQKNAVAREKEKIVKELKIANQPILVLEYQADQEVRTKTFTWNNISDDRIWINDIRLGAGLDKNVEFRSVRFINESSHPYVIGKWFQSLYPTNQDKYLPLDEKVSPSKVKFRFYSIEMERENAVVDDLIDGVSLNLLQEKEGPVRFSIESDVDNYSQQIKNFIGEYNYTMDFINISIAPDEKALSSTLIEPALKEKVGVFNSDRDIRRMKDIMREIFQSGYVVEENSRQVFLSELGMTLFASRSQPYHIDSAKLELDESIFEAKLLEYGDKIKNFLRFDSDGNYVPDGGFAYRIEQLLSEYLAPNSIFTSMERNLKRQGKSLDRSLGSEQRRLDSYREKLERDFTKVNQARNQQETLENWFKSAGQ